MEKVVWLHYEFEAHFPWFLDFLLKPYFSTAVALLVLYKLFKISSFPSPPPKKKKSVGDGKIK